MQKLFSKILFKLMTNPFFRKAIKNIRNDRYIRLTITEPRRTYLMSEPKNHTSTKNFRNFISNGKENIKDTDELIT